MANISEIRLQELLQAEERLLERNKQDSCRWVGEELGRALACSLAMKPYDDWTQQEKMLLGIVADRAPVAKRVYIDLLPKS